MRKLLIIRQLSVPVPGSFCCGGGCWCFRGKSRRDNGLRKDWQKCCYGVGPVWVRCGSGVGPVWIRSGSLGTCERHRLQGIVKPNRLVFGPETHVRRAAGSNAGFGLKSCSVRGVPSLGGGRRQGRATSSTALNEVGKPKPESRGSTEPRAHSASRSTSPISMYCPPAVWWQWIAMRFWPGRRAALAVALRGHAS